MDRSVQMSARAFDLSSSKRFSKGLVCFSCGSAILIFLPVREAHPPVRISVFDSSHPGGSKELSSCGSLSLCLILFCFLKIIQFWGKTV